MNWKTLAIILLVIVLMETSWIGYGIYVYKKEIKDTNICFYEMCKEYPEAHLLNGVCTCYNYDNLGYLIEADWKLMD